MCEDEGEGFFFYFLSTEGGWRRILVEIKKKLRSYIGGKNKDFREQ